MSNEKYNGWTNRATWNVNLWIMNDEYSYRRIMANRPFTPEKAKSIILEMYPCGTVDMDSVDEMDNVNWQEIADAWNED